MSTWIPCMTAHFLLDLENYYTSWSSIILVGFYWWKHWILLNR